jgi:hypothetical protein
MKRRQPTRSDRPPLGGLFHALVAVWLALAFCWGVMGCGSFRTVRTPTENRIPNYLSSVGTHYWEGVEIPYYLDGGSDTERTAAIAGMGLWNRLPSPVPDFARKLKREESTVTVRFVSRDTLPAGVVGQADWWGESGQTTGKTVRAEIRIARGLGYFATVAVAAHEGGHTMGIGDNQGRDHSPNPRDLMAPQVANLQTTLTVADANTMLSIYEK